MINRLAVGLCVLLLGFTLIPERITADDDQSGIHRLLYVASPGIRDHLEYGGHGILVFDIDNGHEFLKRIAIGGLDENGKPINIKGICANAATQRIYVSTLRHLMCLDLVSENLLWERTYDQGCDRMAISPDGKLIYLPTLEKKLWKVIDATSGDEIARVEPDSGSHNTIYGSDGRFVYLAGLKSPILSVANARTHKIQRGVGPFSNSVRPFTINHRQTLCFVNVNNLLGFEIGDLTSGKMLYRVEVSGFEPGKVKRHGCPSHGIGLTPDETQLWVSDGANQQMHIFDATVMPPKQIASLPLREQPGWVTFTIRGDLAYPSTGDIIDVKTQKLVGQLTDEKGRMVMSEKMLEIDFQDGTPILAGDQFGIGRNPNKTTPQ